MRAFIGWLRSLFSAGLVANQANQNTSGHQAPAITAGGNVVVTYIQEASSFRRGDRRVPRQLPDRPVGGHLYGRDAELQTLSGRLKRGDHSAVVGPAGLGKTALAAEAVRIVIGESDESLQASPFPDGVVLLDLYRFKARADDTWNALANALIGNEHASLPARQRAEQACRGRRVLIIIEGAEEADGRESRARLADLRNVFDSENRCLILTRDTAQVPPAEAIKVTEALEPQAAAALFDQIAGLNIRPSLRDAVLELLQGHPLALTWAASLLARGDEGPQQLLNEWKQSSLPRLSDPVEAHHTLQWLFGRSVCTLNAAERLILDAAGLLAHTEFPLAAMRAALGDKRLEPRAALRRLVQLGLLRLSTQQEDHWHFTHVLGYQFARQGSGANRALRDRLQKWLQSELVEFLTRGHCAALSKILLQVAALLGADDDQSQWSLASFCLYDGMERVMALGQLDLAVQLLSGVKTWLEKLPSQTRDSPSWRRERGVLLRRLGDTQQAQGDLAAALRSYSEGKDIAAALAQSDPTDAGWQRDLSVSYDRLGDVQQAQGDLAAALRSYSDGKDIRVKLAQSDPTNGQWQRDLSISYNKLGDVQQAQGDLAAALRSYSKDRDIAAGLAHSDPINAKWQRDLSVSYDRLGDVQQARGDLAAALRSYSDGKDIRVKLAQSDPTNAQWQRDLSISYNKLGDVQRAQGDLAAALRSYSEGKDIRVKLAQSDPTNAQWQRDLSIGYNNLGDVQRTQGDLTAALRSCSEGQNIRVKLTQSDPTNAQWQRDLSIGYNKLGNVQRAQGDLAAALRSYSECRDIRVKLAHSDPTNAQWQRDLSVSYENLGNVQRAQGDLAAALRSYSECRDIRVKLAHSDPTNAQWQRDLSIGYNNLGDVQRTQGDLAAALRSYSKGKDIMAVLAQSDPTNAQWQRDLSHFLMKLSALAELSELRNQALKYAEESLAIDEHLAALDSSNVMWQHAVRVSRAMVARLRGA